MHAAFPPLDPRPPATTAQAAPSRLHFGQEPRTAGPMPGRYLPAAQGGVQHATALNGGAGAADQAQGLSFGDVLDVINPLQHIPVVGMIYRGLTGDTISAAAQIIGGGLFGGPLGAVAGTASAIISRQTGQSPAAALMGAFHDDPSSSRTAQSYADLTGPPVKRYNFNLKA